MRTFILALMLACGIANAADTAVDLQALRGSYTLEDGRVLRVTEHQRKLYVQIGDEAPVELKAAGGTVWRTESGALRLAFTQADNGSVSAVQVERTAPASQLASRTR
jgi:hypothetical protein